jgi:hypothetical protein
VAHEDREDPSVHFLTGQKKPGITGLLAAAATAGYFFVAGAAAGLMPFSFL